MAEQEPKLKYTIVQSPINQIMHQKIFHRLESYSLKRPQQSSNDISSIRKRLEYCTKKSQSFADISQKYARQQKDQRINTRKDQLNQQMLPLPANSYTTDNWIGKDKCLQNQIYQNIDSSKVSTYKQFHSTQSLPQNQPQQSNTTNTHKFNKFLQEITEFKNSIHQIRQKLEHNDSNSRQLSKNFSGKAGKKRGKYQYSHQNYEYTNYKDLSNRGKINRTYERWKSNERPFTFIKDNIMVRQFVIDASDTQASTYTK